MASHSGTTVSCSSTRSRSSAATRSKVCVSRSRTGAWSLRGWWGLSYSFPVHPRRRRTDAEARGEEVMISVGTVLLSTHALRSAKRSGPPVCPGVSHVTDGEGSPCSMSVVRVGDFGHLLGSRPSSPKEAGRAREVGAAEGQGRRARCRRIRTSDTRSRPARHGGHRRRSVVPSASLRAGEGRGSRQRGTM